MWCPLLQLVEWLVFLDQVLVWFLGRVEWVLGVVRKQRVFRLVWVVRWRLFRPQLGLGRVVLGQRFLGQRRRRRRRRRLRVQQLRRRERRTRVLHRDGYCFRYGAM